MEIDLRPGRSAGPLPTKTMQRVLENIASRCRHTFVISSIGLPGFGTGSASLLAASHASRRLGAHSCYCDRRSMSNWA